jgi:hypothetical protein
LHTINCDGSMSCYTWSRWMMLVAYRALLLWDTNHSAGIACVVHSAACVTSATQRWIMAAVALLAAGGVAARNCVAVRQVILRHRDIFLYG